MAGGGFMAGATVPFGRFDRGRASGVEYFRGGQPRFAAANSEVILCAGAVNSPQILQLSGIGPAAVLSALGIAPLLGLVGTIYGMMALFGGLGQSGLGDNTVLAHGISLILRFTMMGLLIAIPSLIAWSYYSKKVEMLAVDMETVCSEFLRRQYHDSSKK